MRRLHHDSREWRTFWSQSRWQALWQIGKKTLEKETRSARVVMTKRCRSFGTKIATRNRPERVNNLHEHPAAGENHRVVASNIDDNRAVVR